MSLEIGSVVEGVVTGITSFGAFVRLPEGNTGLIHISEVADAYVEDVHNFLNEKDKVVVKVLGVNNKGKYDLSIKQVKPVQPSTKTEDIPRDKDKDEEDYPRRDRPPQRPFRKPQSEHSHFHHEGREGNFEDKISKFMKESEDRLLDLKRNTEAKRGKGKGR
jgi:S1 RNA binding domain protein